MYVMKQLRVNTLVYERGALIMRGIIIFLPRQVIEHEEGEFDKKNMISSSSSDSHSLVMLVLAEYDGSTTLLRVRSNEEGSEYS